MKRKNFDLENSNKHWNINEIAFLEFCRRKDLSYKEIAPLLDRSFSSVTQMGSKVGQWQKDKLDPKSPHKAKIEKAMAMELAVRGGTYPDMRSAWYSRITRATGITYDVPISPLDKTAEELVAETKVDAQVEEVAEEDDTFVSIKIELGFARAKELLKLIFGK